MYTVDESEPSLNRVKTVAANSKDTYAWTNNDYVGKVAVNALEMVSLIKGEAVKAPPQLVEHYSALREFTVPGRP